MNSKNITDTDSRLFEGLSNIVKDVYTQQGIDDKIKNTVEENMITTGYVTKYYPYLNKCEVRLDTTGKKVLCRIGSLFGGDLLFLYTPSGDEGYCRSLNEPCVFPRGRVSCLVANINDDTDEYVLINYYFPNELIGLNPSAPGNFKIIAVGGVNEYNIKFGLDGLKITSNGMIETTELDDLDGEISKEHYTKQEIDELLVKMKEDILTELQGTSETNENEQENIDNTNNGG